MTLAVLQALIISVPTSGAQTQAAPPTFSLNPAGTYPPGTTVALSSTTAGSTIYYAINATPTYPVSGNTQQYSGPITLTQSETIYALTVAPGYANSTVSNATYTISSGGGATQIFNYLSGFTSMSPFSTGGDAGIGLYEGGIILGVTSGMIHSSGGLWYTSQQNNTSWMTEFIIQSLAIGTGVPGQVLSVPANTGGGAGGGLATAGITFGFQNSTSPPVGGGSAFSGQHLCVDANCDGWGSYTPAPTYNQAGSANNAVALKYDLGWQRSCKFRPASNNPSTTGLYINGGGYTSIGQNTGDYNNYGGPYGGLDPEQDLNPYGINFYNNNPVHVKVVYDGSKLVQVLTDTVTNKQARFQYTVNISNICTPTGATTSWIGFTEGQAPEPIGSQTLLKGWAFWSGYNARLAIATPNVSPGNYGSSASINVTLSIPANSNVYYTTNGLLPGSGSNSTQYSGGNITLTSNTVLQWVSVDATGSGYTDSYVGGGLYIVNNSAGHSINYPNGFAANDGMLIIGYAYLNGSAIQMMDQLSTGLTASSVGPNINARVGNAWYGAPVQVTGNWSTTFVFTCTGSGDGFTFIIQTPYIPSTAPNINNWGGCNGPFISATGVAHGLGYGGYNSPTANADNQTSPGILNSLAVKFNPYAGNTTGLYLNGALPEDGGGTAITGVNITSGAAVTCTFAYTASTTLLAMTLTQGSQTYQQNFTVNIASVLNSSSTGITTATVGFGAAGGGSFNNLQILSWTGF